MMLLLAAAAIAATPSANRTSEPPVVLQATATVRIISGVRLKLDSSTNAGAPPAHDVIVVGSDGTPQQARLIEFE